LKCIRFRQRNSEGVRYFQQQVTTTTTTTTTTVAGATTMTNPFIIALTTPGGVETMLQARVVLHFTPYIVLAVPFLE
jgi:hypothetical protein